MIMSKHSTSYLNEDGLIICGYQRKLKTMKKKYFVLYKDTLINGARLEYYDNERKFKSGLAPKRVIKLKNCYNINRRLDTKYQFVIALSTKDGGFGIVMDTENEMYTWLELLTAHLNYSDGLQQPFDHVWQVMVQKKGLAEEKGIFGNYYVALTSKSLTLIRIGSEKVDKTSGNTKRSNVEFMLTTIRRCGDSQCVFYIEVGRQSVIGPGELWMETEDPLIAQNMHQTILGVMSAKNDLEPMRKRSSSANEASKPISMLHRKQSQTEQKTYSPQQNNSFGRDRCDSLPSRNRTSSECSNQSITAPLGIRNTSGPGLRLQSYQRHSNSPPVSNSIVCSESEESSISMDEPDDNGFFHPSYRFNSRQTKGVILEENSDDFVTSDVKYNIDNNIDTNTPSSNLNTQNDESYVTMAPVKNPKTVSAINTLNCVSKDQSKYYPSSRLHKHGTNTDFLDYAVNTSKSFLYASEGSPQSELPPRTYSVGNRPEHNIKKNLGNLNEAEQNAVRVRACSVGSRAKIPQCELQRGALLLKASRTFNNSNNNICPTNDPSIYNQSLNINTCREKKSTSAPLLIHKNLNPDLMEIDFSKSSNNMKLKVAEHKTQSSKCTPNTNREQNKKSLSNTDAERISKVKNLIRPVYPTGQTDNGYLEMKPVGNIYSKSATSTYSTTDNIKASSEQPNTNTALKSKINAVTPYSYMNTAVLTSKRNIFIKGENTLDFKKSCEQQNAKQENATQIDDNRTKLLSNETSTCNVNNKELLNNCAQFLLETEKKSESEDDYVNIENKYKQNIKITQINNQLNKPKAKLPEQNNYNNHSSLSENINQNRLNDTCELTKKVFSNDVGYEILQIKSDSSLQVHKSQNHQYNVRRDKHCQNYQQSQQQPSRPNTSTALTATTSPLCATSILSVCTTSSSTSNINYLPVSNTQLQTLTKDVNISSNNKTSNAASNKSHVQLNIISRPPSVSSEYELYYASLDLPQCTTDINTVKMNKNDGVTECSGHTPVIDICNSYAKIDFDHSDSSSSSSKNINN